MHSQNTVAYVGALEKSQNQIPYLQQYEFRLIAKLPCLRLSSNVSFMPVVYPELLNLSQQQNAHGNLFDNVTTARRMSWTFYFGAAVNQPS